MMLPQASYSPFPKVLEALTTEMTYMKIHVKTLLQSHTGPVHRFLLPWAKDLMMPIYLHQNYIQHKYVKTNLKHILLYTNPYPYKLKISLKLEIECYINNCITIQ